MLKLRPPAGLALLAQWLGPCRAVLPVVLVLAAAGCTVAAHGELTATDCQDKQDNDGKNGIDCADPSCWVYSFCGAHAEQPAADAGGSAGTSAGDAGPAAQDAGRDAMPIDDDDAMTPMNEPDANVAPDAGLDAGTTTGSCGGVKCESTQICLDDTCTRPIKFSIRVNSANVPLTTITNQCYDVCPLGPVYGPGCLCQPDPYVVTTVNDVVVNTTEVINDTLAASFDPDAHFEVTITDPDKKALAFTVYDGPPEMKALEPDPKFFTCKPNLAAMKTVNNAVLQCSAPLGGNLPLSATGYQVIAEYTAVLTP